jgi:hypothetical protein
MKQKISSMRKLAEHLIALEAGSADAVGRVLPAEPVCDRLRPHLATLMGTTGFRTLLARALALATPKVAALRAMHVTPQGTLERLAAPAVQGKFAPDPEGSVVLVAELLGLLQTFIGLNLTLQLIRDIWPELSVSEANFEPGDDV